MSKPLRILLIEDSEDDALLLLRELKRGGYEPLCERVETPEAMREALGNREWDIVISDYVLPGFSGLAALDVLKAGGRDLPFIVVSGNIGEDVAVAAMKAGAHDYILKGSLARLVPAVERELREAETRRGRKSAEEELIRLASAVEASADAVVITGADGAVQYVNPAFEQITGYTRNEVLGLNIDILDSGKHDELSLENLRGKLLRDGVWRGRLMNKKKDGTLYFEECTYSLVRGPAGEIVNYVSVKRDVTDKLRFESIAESKNLMENIGYIFSGVRHEIGNPVNSAKMALTLLQYKLEELPKKAVGEYLDRVMNDLCRVEHILKGLKTFNLFETPEMELLDAPRFFRDFLKLIGEDFEKNGIAVALDVGPGGERLYADPRVLQQVLLNVMTNAADALAGREAPSIFLTAEKKTGRVLIRVEDNGEGLTEDQQRNLFKPFYTSKKKGTGLGLVIVKKMLTKMGGDIEITSVRNRGTTVRILLPEPGAKEGPLFGNAKLAGEHENRTHHS